MNIDFVMRSDSETKFGGDVLQVQQYKNLLEELGYAVRLVPFQPRMSLRGDSIVHIVNIDRPYDFLSAIRQAGNRAVFVSPIHHNLELVREMRKAETGNSLRAIVGRTMPEAFREFLAFSARCAARVDSLSAGLATVLAIGRAMPEVWRVWARVGHALNRVAGVALLAHGEGESVRSDTGWLGENSLLTPNGRPASPATGVSGVPWRERAVEILVVGRIEPRKRQVEVAEIASRLKIRVTFVGDINENAGSYSQRFMQIVDGSDSLTWLGRLSHKETLGVMAQSRVLLNASWVEVQSLVDIEGYLAGCLVVAAVNGNSGEFLGESFVEVPGGLEDLVLRACELAVGEAPSTLVEYDWTWKIASNVLHDAYRETVRGGNDR